MHTVHNCHYIKSFHPPVKQYITIHHNTESIYPFTCICNSKVAMARAALCVILCAVYCILASFLLGVPRLKFPSFPVSIPPTLLPCSSPSLRCSLPPPLASSSPLALAPSMPMFLLHSFPSSTPSPFPTHTLPHIIASSLPLLLPPSHPPSFIAPSLPACFTPSNSMWTPVCVWQAALNCVAPSHA